MSSRLEIKRAENGWIVDTYRPGDGLLEPPIIQTLVFKSLEDVFTFVRDFYSETTTN